MTNLVVEMGGNLARWTAGTLRAFRTGWRAVLMVLGGILGWSLPGWWGITAALVLGLGLMALLLFVRDEAEQQWRRS